MTRSFALHAISFRLAARGGANAMRARRPTPERVPPHS